MPDDVRREQAERLMREVSGLISNDEARAPSLITIDKAVDIAVKMVEAERWRTAHHFHSIHGTICYCTTMDIRQTPTEPPYTGTTITTKKVPTTETSREARCPTCGLRDNQVFPYQRPCPDCQKETP